MNVTLGMRTALWFRLITFCSCFTCSKNVLQENEGHDEVYGATRRRDRQNERGKERGGGREREGGREEGRKGGREGGRERERQAGRTYGGMKMVPYDR